MDSALEGDGFELPVPREKSRYGSGSSPGVRLALLGYVVEWDKAGLPTAARSISGRAIVASSLIHRRFLRDLEAVGRGEDPKAVIRDPQLNHSIRALANIDG
jgi:hypothetical protein